MEKTVFLVPLNGLATGKTAFVWTAGKEFFDRFGNSEMIDAKVSVNAEVEKSGQYIGIDCHIEGEVIVECDRCLADLTLPIDVCVRLSVKFGDDADEGLEGEDHREIICVPSIDADLDLSQIVYDYTCLALPMQKVHPDGECDPEVVSRLGGRTEEEQPDTESNPFAALKGIFN